MSKREGGVQPDGGAAKGAYARQVHEGTKRFAQEILAENEKLRSLAATLQSEKLRVEEESLALREEIHRHRREALRLERELAEIEAENRRFSQRYVEVERQNSNLVNLYVASYRLHGTLDRNEVLATIREIIVNLVGSEELAIFEVNPEGTELRLSGSFGIEPEGQAVPVGAGPIGRAAATGEMYLAGEGRANPAQPAADGLTACVPLKLADKVTGVIAVFRLLPQKPGLEPLDRELFELLATHAAMALYCTGLHARLGGAAAA